MGLTKYPNGVSSFGIPVIGSGDAVPTTVGSYFFVNSASGNNANTGTSPEAAKATIDAAIGLCTAGKGDVIIVAAGHAETISGAAAINFDIAGVTLVGLGKGAARPTVTSSTTADTVAVNAANITIKNILFQGGIDSQTIFLDINSTDCTVENCEFREGSSIQILTSIDVNGGAANACDRTTIRGCRIFSVAAGADRGIELGEVANNVLIEGCIIDGDFSDAGIHNITGKVLTNLRILNNVVRNRQTGDHAIELVSACTGECVGNSLFGDTVGSILDPGSLFCVENYATDAIDQSSYPVPETVQDTAANLIGVNDSNNVADTSNVVANVNGSVLERLEALMDPTATYNPRLGFSVSKVSNLADGSGTDNLFTVTGRVLITSLTGEVTTVIGGAATLKLRDITNSIDLCAATTIDTDAVGTMYALSSISANVLNGTGMTPVVGSVPNLTGSSHVDVAIVGDAQAALTIAQVLDAADTGAITWVLTYIPLVSGATVTAAA